MDSDNSNDGPIHRRRTQGTRPPSSHQSLDRGYHPTKEENETYSDEEDDEHFQENSYDDLDQHQSFPRYSGLLRDQDRFLPIANIAKIMKKGIPEKGKIAKDAKETIQECVSEFVSFVTSEASDRCLQEKRKTINGEDILLAMLALGFDSYIEPLKIFLAKIRDASKYDRTITINGDLPDDMPKQITTATTTTSNSNELEPYANSVRVVTCHRTDQNEEHGNYVYTIQPYQ